ncbi:MAG: alpha-ribazole phosphatase [Candidatus Melainabacteria bacterium]
MDVCLIRHTTPSVGRGICYGQSDVALAASFEQEAYALWRSLEAKTQGAVTPVRIVTSPLQRCRLLADFLKGKIPKSTLVFDDRLQELSFGDWEGHPWSEIEKHTYFAVWMNDFVNVACPGGESYCELASRAQECLQHWSNQPERTVLVTHAGVIRALLAYQLGISLEQSFELPVNYGDVFHLTDSSVMTAL